MSPSKTLAPSGITFSGYEQGRSGGYVRICSAFKGGCNGLFSSHRFPFYHVSLIHHQYSSLGDQFQCTPSTSTLGKDGWRGKVQISKLALIPSGTDEKTLTLLLTTQALYNLRHNERQLAKENCFFWSVAATGLPHWRPLRCLTSERVEQHLWKRHVFHVSCHFFH